MKLTPLDESVAFTDPRIISSIERLNGHGLEAILADQELVTADMTPTMVTWPVGRKGEPFSEFDGAVTRFYGYANGHRLQEARVISALLADVSDRPVIATPFPNRDWVGAHDPSHVKGWNTMTRFEKFSASIHLFDEAAAVAVNALRYLEKMPEFGAAKRIVTSGESLGAAIALAAAHVFRGDHDLDGAALLALPNLERRLVYPELLLRDFRHAMPIQGLIVREVVMTDVVLEPLATAFGVDRTGNPTGLLRGDDFQFFFSDIGGRYLRNYPRNRSFSRALSQPTGGRMLERVAYNDKDLPRMTLGIFNQDPVARPAAFEALTASRASIPNLYAHVFAEHDHAACNNPYFVAHGLLKVLNK